MANVVMTDVISEYGTIQAFLEKMDPKSLEVQKALGTTERQTELMWTALNSVTEESGLALPNFGKLAAKFIKFPHNYLNELRKRGLIERGKTRGNWLITQKAVRKMMALLSGESVVEEPTIETQITTSRRVKKIPVKIARQTVGQLIKEPSLNNFLMIYYTHDNRNAVYGNAYTS